MDVSYNPEKNKPLSSIPMDPRHCILIMKWGGTTVSVACLLKSIDIHVFICFYTYFVLRVSNSI